MRGSRVQLLPRSELGCKSTTAWLEIRDPWKHAKYPPPPPTLLDGQEVFRGQVCSNVRDESKPILYRRTVLVLGVKPVGTPTPQPPVLRRQRQPHEQYRKGVRALCRLSGLKASCITCGNA